MSSKFYPTYFSVSPKSAGMITLPVTTSALRGQRWLLSIDVQVLFCATAKDWDCSYLLFRHTTIGLSPSRGCNFFLLSLYLYLQLAVSYPL